MEPIAPITQRMLVAPVLECGICWDSEGASLYPFHRFRGPSGDGSNSMEGSQSRAGARTARARCSSLPRTTAGARAGDPRKLAGAQGCRRPGLGVARRAHGERSWAAPWCQSPGGPPPGRKGHPNPMPLPHLGLPSSQSGPETRDCEKQRQHLHFCPTQ